MSLDKSTQYCYNALVPKRQTASQTNKISTYTAFSDYETVQRLNESVNLARQAIKKSTKCTESQTDASWNSKLPTFTASFATQFKMLVSSFPSLVWFEKESSTKQCFIEICRKNGYEPRYNTEASKYILSADGNLRFHVIFKGTIREVNVLTDTHTLDTDLVLELLGDFTSKEYVLCEGLGKEAIEIIPTLINLPKKLIKHSYPAERFNSVDCPAWFKKPNNTTGPLQNVCTACKNLSSYLKVCQKRRIESNKSPSRKRKMNPSSTIPEQFLSPYSLRKKKRSQLFRYQNLKTRNAKLEAKLEALQIFLKSKQHLQMKEITSTINNQFPEVVDMAIGPDTPSTKESRKRLREIWENDCAAYLEKEKEDYQTDQNRNSPGKRGNRWSLVTYRIALAVACRSKAAYEALKSFKILNLPSWRSIQRKTSKNLDEPGINMDYLNEQKNIYDKFVEEQVSLGMLKPQSDGILVFDEVRVAAKVVWNSKNHKLIGLAMARQDYAYLEDLYAEVSDENSISKANYMLQFLWRDITANYDIIGPYFSTASTCDTQFTFNCLFEVIKSFQFCGFNIAALVCDGASANLSLIKMTVGLQGQFSYFERDEADAIKVEFNPCFVNPYRLGRNIYWIICPSHQLKSLINALYSSDPERAKLFAINEVKFGWKQIKDLKERDDNRRADNIPRLVPALHQSYVDRDPWTKLNVKPAKIMQQNDILAALYEYANPKLTKPPPDHEEVQATFNYLKACNNLFETGTLSHSKIKTADGGEVMKNIRNGLDFFTKWLKSLIDADPQLKPWDVKQKTFLSWQTWALLRIMVFGLEGLVKEFFENYSEGYYLCPVRINGSAVETLFSQFKQNSGGKLSSVNYNTARKVLLTKIDVKGHHSGHGYRDVPLYVRDAFEEKFKNKKTNQ